TILTGNRIWIDRNKGVGVITAGDAIGLGLSGPALRASGVKWDIRKDEPYLCYDRVYFDVPTGENGDSFDRYMVRVNEMRQSTRIIEQCLRDMPEGPINIDMNEIVPPPKPDVFKNMESLIHHFKYVSHGFKVPKGEVYSAIEAPKGELGVYIVSDGSEKPYRLKLRVPSFMNLQCLNHMSKGAYFADIISVLSSLDPVFGECDK
ncbi:NADH-quinone oxidoreductase subunit D, partial [bacterium]